jgi:hypothetical protein
MSARLAEGALSVTYWSAPISLPDFASPMYCICFHHSRKPTRRMFLSVLAKETIVNLVVSKVDRICPKS